MYGHIHGDAVHVIHAVAGVYVAVFLIKLIGGLHSDNAAAVGLVTPFA